MYTSLVSARHPACVVFLIDGSEAMGQPATPGERPLAEVAANAVNSSLYDMCRRSCLRETSPPIGYVDVGVFAYGQSRSCTADPAGSALGVFEPGELSAIDVLSANPLETRGIRKRPDLPAVPKPVWFDPVVGCTTPLADVLQHAHGRISSWVRRHRDSFPPIVVNITGGQTPDAAHHGADVRAAIAAITDERTSDGPTLFFNAVLSPAGNHQAVWCPATPDHLCGGGSVLFHVSSALPESMANQAQRAGSRVDPGGRGLLLNADTAALSRFIDLCTRLDIERRQLAER